MSILRQGHGLSFSPYGLIRTDKNYISDESSARGTTGGDVSYNLTPGLAGFLTLNTDFAETEVDTRQVNLTRFPLLFPKKRTFFLEGSDLFNFGIGIEETFFPFYSRRVGLYEGEQIPIAAGVKLLGRVPAFVK